MLGFVTGALPYDVLLIQSAWLPDFAPFLSPAPQSLVESPAFADILPIYRDALMRWRGRWMALTIDGDLHMGAYRRDLFGDPANRQAFQARYGRPLEPPRTWGSTAISRPSSTAVTPRMGPRWPGRWRPTRAAASASGTCSAMRRPMPATRTAPAGCSSTPTPWSRPSTTLPWVRALEEFLDLRRFGPTDAWTSTARRYADGSRTARGRWTSTGPIPASGRRSAPLPGRRQARVLPLPGSRGGLEPRRAGGGIGWQSRAR